MTPAIDENAKNAHPGRSSVRKSGLPFGCPKHEPPDMNVRRRMWALGFVVKRWKPLLWIGPLTGTAVGLVMVWGFSHANEHSIRSFQSQLLSAHEPDGHEDLILAWLRSDEAMRTVRDALVKERGRAWKPLWWMRRSVDITATRQHWNRYDIGFLNIAAAHPSEEVARETAELFEEVGRRRIEESYQSLMNEWLEKRRILIKEVAGSPDVGSLKAQLDSVENSEDPLKQWLNLMNGGTDLRIQKPILSGTVPRHAKGWDALPAWWKFLAICTGWGLLGGVALAYVGEAMFPRKPLG